MKTVTLVIAALYGLFSIILGAFGAHAFKSILSAEKLISFETGVRYQMYGALFLLLVGFFLKFETPLERWISWLMIIGVVFFSFSIYMLSFQEYWGVSLKFLGPVTPIGGVMMLVSWGLLCLHFLKHK